MPIFILILVFSHPQMVAFINSRWQIGYVLLMPYSYICNGKKGGFKNDNAIVVNYAKATANRDTKLNDSERKKDFIDYIVSYYFLT